MGPHFEQLTTKETRQLAEFEKTFTEGWETFIKVGAASNAIRVPKLYRAAYTTFKNLLRKW